MIKAFVALDEARQEALADDLHALISRMNQADGTMVVPGAYLEVVITKR